MSEFVDYTKRSVTLPAGCKDLVDVLKDEDTSGRTDTAEYSAEAFFTPSTHHHENATLNDVLNRVWELFVCQAERFTLLVEVGGKSLFTLRATGEYVFVSTWVANDPETAGRLTEFSDSCNIRLRQIPVETIKAPADSTHYVLQLLPPEKSRVRQITAELFQSVHQRNSGLSMHW